jgi:Zn-dependent protease with chaperone function
MSGLLSEVVLVTTACLVALPLVSRRFRRALRPNEHVRFNTTTMVAGLALLEAALLVCAVPVIAGLWTSGSFDRHFFPGDTVIGWVSAILAIVVAGSVAFGAIQLRRAEARLRIESWIGLHEQRDGYELVVLELDQPLAYAVAGRARQVVITSGLVDRLSEAELDAVIAHELAHLRLGHRRALAALGAAEAIARLVRPLTRVVAAARFAIEHAADAATDDHSATRRALQKLGGVDVTAAVAAFTAGEVADRIHALSMPPSTKPSWRIRAGLYAAAGGMAALSVAILVAYWI